MTIVVTVPEIYDQEFEKLEEQVMQKFEKLGAEGLDVKMLQGQLSIEKPNPGRARATYKRIVDVGCSIGRSGREWSGIMVASQIGGKRWAGGNLCTYLLVTQIRTGKQDHHEIQEWEYGVRLSQKRLDELAKRNKT
ncbi:MAG: hypothetical protein Q9213_002108 [Squamulea squamosa]